MDLGTTVRTTEPADSLVLSLTHSLTCMNAIDGWLSCSLVYWPTTVRDLSHLATACECDSHARSRRCCLRAWSDPIFPAVILFNTWIFPFIDQMLAVSFVVLLFLFFITTMDSFRKEHTGFLAAHWPKLILLGSLWLLAISVWAWVQYNDLTDPEFSSPSDVPYYHVRVHRRSFNRMRLAHSLTHTHTHRCSKSSSSCWH